MERKKMIELMMANAEAILGDSLDYDPTEFEKKRLLSQERERLEKKTDLELQNMVMINCG